MAVKLIVLLAAVASAHAGLSPLAVPVAHYSPAAAVSSAYINMLTAPVAHAAYAAPVATVHDPHYGETSQSVVRSLGGGQAVAHYSKAVDGAFSSVRKYDTRVTNDGLPVAYGSPVLTRPIAAPVAHATYGAPLAPLVAPVAHVATAPVVTKAAVAYSPAVAVAHATFTGFGAQYAW